MSIKSLIEGKKRYAVAAMAAATLGGGAFAFANSLSPTSNTLGSGSVSVASPGCNPVASYTTAWNGNLQRFDIDTVTVTDPSATGTCGTDSVRIALQQGSSPTYTSLGTSPAAANLSSGAASFSVLSQQLDASLLTHIAVAVTGAS